MLKFMIFNDRWENEGSTEPVDHPAAPRRKFRPHACGPACMSEFKYDESEHKLFNVLLIPILLGWERVLSKHRTGGRRRVFYIAPCGRRCRNLDEVHRYLRITASDLEIDFFNFDWWLHVRNEFKPAREFCTIKDLSYGKENVPVSCVNSIDRNYPEYVEYSTVRLPQKNVSINTSPEFMTCCDCTDDCSNKEKCACWQMTIQVSVMCANVFMFSKMRRCRGLLAMLKTKWTGMLATRTEGSQKLSSRGSLNATASVVARKPA